MKGLLIIIGLALVVVSLCLSYQLLIAIAIHVGFDLGLTKALFWTIVAATITMQIVNEMND